MEGFVNVDRKNAINNIFHIFDREKSFDNSQIFEQQFKGECAIDPNTDSMTFRLSRIEENEFEMTTRTLLPLTRVSTIMKSSSDVDNVGKDSTIMMAKATELFIKKLVIDGYNRMKSGKSTGKFLHYQFLAEIVQNDDKYEFLRDMMPKKITVLEYKKIISKKKEESGIKSGNSSDTSSDSDSEDSSSSSSSGSSSSDNSVISVNSA